MLKAQAKARAESRKAQAEAEEANESWAAMKDEFARREAEQERQAYLDEMRTQGV